MALWRYVFLALLLWGIFGAASAQAIDCASPALNNSERAVCASGSLHALAASMDRRYARIADEPDVKRSQQQWLGIRDRCNGNVNCLTRAYRERNAYLAGLPAIIPTATTSTPSPRPIKHLFLRHAPAQLLSSSPTASPPIETNDFGKQLDRAAGPVAVPSRTPHWGALWSLGAILLASAVLWQMLTNVCGKCPHCHQWFARVEVDSRPIPDDAPELVTLRRSSLYSFTAARPLRNNRERLPAMRHYNQCRVCLHEWETVTQRTH